MAEFKASTSGGKLQIANETALGAVGSWRDMEFNDGLELPTTTRQAYKPPIGGRTNPADTTTVIDHEDGTGTGTLPIMARRGTTTLEPTMGPLLRSGGFLLSGITSLTTTAAGTIVGSIVQTADNAMENGLAVAIEQDDGSYEPTQGSPWTVGTTTFVPVHDLATAPTDGNPIQKMFLYYPQTGPVPSDATVALRYLSRVEDGAANPQQWTHTGVAAKLAPITITPNMPLELSFYLLIAKTEMSDGTWAAETFNDRAELAMTDNRFRFLMKQGDATTGGLDNTPVCLLKEATIDLGIEITPIKCVGGTNTNTTGGYMVEFVSAPKITVQTVYDVTKVEDFETTYSGGSGTNPDTALQFNWIGGSVLHPTAMISAPRCKLVEAPVTINRNTDSKLVEQTLVFEATGAALGSEDGPTNLADQAIYIAMSGQLS